MKARFSKFVGFLTVLWLTLCTGVPRVNAQTPPVLDIHLYAGLSITGFVGTMYSVEYVTDLAQTNTPSAWQCLEYLQLPASPYLWADKSAPSTGKRFYRAVAMEPPRNMVFIPPGTFRMGSPTNEMGPFDYEGPQTAVTLSRGFWMGKYEVTRGEYRLVIGTDPSRWPGSTNCAVDSVTWPDATNYCGRLTGQERAVGRIATNCVYRLPTEAEWEYACRAWTSTRFSYGEDSAYTNLASYAWYEDTPGGQPHEVGQKLPNSWGLYDMHGNVWEWCQDRGAERLPGGAVLDPQGPELGTGRVYRGGGWDSAAESCHSAHRVFNSEYTASDQLGFRIVLAPGQP